MGKVKPIDLYNQLIEHNALIVCRGTNYNGKDLSADIHRATSFLKDYRDIVLCATNSYYWLVFYFASILTGKNIYLIDPGREKDVLSQLIEQIKPDVTLHSDEQMSKVLNCDVSDEIQFKDGATVVFYTTGSTGVPKGVVHTVDSIFSSVFAMQKTFRYEDADYYYAVVQFSHVMGHSLAMLALLYGAALVISDGNPFPSESQKITIMALPPAIIMLYVRINAKVKFLASLRMLITGGAPLPESYHNLLIDNGVNLFYGYGSTECITTASSRSDGVRNKLYYPLDGVHICLSDEGELLMKTDFAGKSYFNGNAIVDMSGVYHTNDCAVIYDDGGFEILGRKDTMIVLGSGYKVFPEALEQKIIKLFDEIDDCVVLSELKNSSDVLALKVKVKQNSAIPDNFLSRINQKLNDYEKISNLEIVDELQLVGNKKKRK